MEIQTLNEQNYFDSYNLDTLFDPENNEIIPIINEILNEIIINVENKIDENLLDNQDNNSNQFIDINYFLFDSSCSSNINASSSVKFN